MILICVNELAGPTGYHKSVVETANALHRGGYALAVISFLGQDDGSARAMPRWPLDEGIPAFALQNLPADGGALLAQNVHPSFAGRVYSTPYEFTPNQLAALRQLNTELTNEDTIIFTTPVQALAFHHALEGAERQVRTVLQAHGDYRHHHELWNLVHEARATIDVVQTVARGLMEQFHPLFAPSDVVCIPNIHHPSAIARSPHDGIDIVLPASFQRRKNQLDAIQALALIDDPTVRLTLWGNISPLNPYFIAVQEQIDHLGLQDRVRIPGFGTERDVYASADIVLMTSLSEGFGYPLLEAAHHRLPTVTYDYEFGPRDVVEDGGSGWIVPVGDVEELAEKLRSLVADPALRTRFGARAREIFDERFSARAVVEQYTHILGPPPGRAVDIVDLFAVDGMEPIPMDQIGHRVRRAGRRLVHRVTVASPTELHDVQVDDGERITQPKVKRDRGRTVIEFPVGHHDVVSYATEPGSTVRHYLAGPADGRDLPVQPRLRRDADYGMGIPMVADTLFASQGGARYLSWRTTSQALVDLPGEVCEAVAWKVRQLLPSSGRRGLLGGRTERSTAVEGGDEPQKPSASDPQPAVEPRAAGGAQTTGREQVMEFAMLAMTSMRRTATAYAQAALRLLAGAVAVKASEPTRREVTRHPWFPVTGGSDSFGAAVNTAGGVEVVNRGTSQCPTVSVRGEYDSLTLRDGAGARQITPPWSYGEFFERICAAEREHGLFDITVAGGVHVWELGRSALVIQLAEAAGLWGAASAIGTPVRDVYDGPKRLTSAPSARRVVFDYVRRGQSGYRTAPFVDDKTLFVVQPDAEGYPGVEDSEMVYPFAEFTQWGKRWPQMWKHLRVPEIDARPFEAALSDALGIRVDLGDHLRNRLAKFLAERDFFTPVFERIAPEEVLVASSHWRAGIGAAAARAGARFSDIQYALTSRYAPSFWFGDTPRYGATRFYTWSDFWAERTNAYQEHVVVPREQPELTDAIRNPRTADPSWDVCIISQPRVLRRILAFVQDLVRERPELRVVIAPHPAQRALMPRELAAAGLDDAVTIAEDDTLTTITRSRIAVGTFSTSLWESAAMGCPTYVIEVPGFEETLQDIESGLFRLARSPHDLEPYEVPEHRSRIFG